MPLISTRGAASAQGFGEFAQSAAPVYIEDVFSTYLYTGNGSTQTITNGIDLSGKGGLVWLKGRSGATDHALYDTARGATKDLVSNSAAAGTTQSTGLTAFSGTGFSIGALAKLNTNAATYASWTFREQAKFFDVVTWTGNGSDPRTISHNLGSTPGCIIAKKTSATANWFVYHRGLSNSDLNNIYLNGTNAASNLDSPGWGVTSTGFTARAAASLNDNGATYVAYLFAHDAGGFGLTGSDNVISCGSFTTDGSGNATVTLGYEPQWLLLKRTDAAEIWQLYDNMRGLTYASTGDARLIPNSTQEEFLVNCVNLTATGFVVQAGYELSPDATYIYIAIRRGPMKVPTSGTSVFSPNTSSGAEGTSVTTNFPLDLGLIAPQSGGNRIVADRLRGIISTAVTSLSPRLQTNTTSAEANEYVSRNWSNVGFQVPAAFGGVSTVYYSFRRAPGFFDVVCYTGTGSNRTVAHNLGVVPELIFVKGRSQAGTYWVVRNASLASGNILYLSLDYASTENSNVFTTTAPTASVFSVGTNDSSNASGQTLVAYLFATLAGVSKVGSYTGSGTTKQIDCGFTAGARFVLIKRTDSTGDWYVYDSARGIVAGNDPYLFLNSTAAEVTNTDYVDTYSAGFELSSTAPAGLNANGGTYIFLAIA